MFFPRRSSTLNDSWKVKYLSLKTNLFLTSWNIKLLLPGNIIFLVLKLKTFLLKDSFPLKYDKSGLFLLAAKKELLKTAESFTFPELIKLGTFFLLHYNISMVNIVYHVIHITDSMYRVNVILSKGP